MKFENVIFEPNFYYGILSLGIKIAIFATIAYILLAIFIPSAAKNVFPHIKLYMNIAKFITCVLVVMLVFCFDYETKQIVFFASLDGMSFSTFSVGALALWELVAMVTDFLSTINDNLPDKRF